MLGLTKRKTAQPDATGLMPVQRGSVLLAGHATTITSIRSIVGVPRQHWSALYQALFVAFADYVQGLPASEAHHHCEAGGLLRHALDVTELALKIRRGYVLPPGKEPEVVADEQDVWTYAVASAALLHDAGKPLVDQAVTLYGRDGLPLSVWSPWVGSMTGAGARHYRVDFRRGRQHRLHDAVTPLLVGHIMPEDGRRWLGCHHDALAAWLAAVNGHTVGAAIIAEIVSEADQLSVARDLSGERHQLPGAHAKPLAERLLVALRQLLDSGALPINRQGGAAFVDERYVWLVSKRCLDAIREAMQGQLGVPSRNDRLMDELQQRGIAVATPDDRAVWTCEVQVGSGADVWHQSLTLLCIPIDQVWPEPEARPPPADVEVTATHAESSPQAPVDVPVSTQTHEPAVRTDAGELTADELMSADDRSAVNKDIVEPNADFLPWLIDGLTRGTLAINTAKARVHAVEEGLLLVSPAIFRAFANEQWQDAQKQFLKRKVNEKTANGENFFHYQVSNNDSTKTIKGVLIRDAEKVLGIQLPESNRHLSLKTGSQ